jgi:hypothetical protein
VCASVDAFSVNVATLKNLASDWSVGHTISTEFKIAPGGQKIAGLVLNYLPNGTYVAVVADVDAGLLKVLRYNGSNFVTEYSLAFQDFGFVFDMSEWYKITATPVINSSNNSITLGGTLSTINGTKLISFLTTLTNYGALSGSAGVIADKTYAYFNKLRIEL